MRPVRLRSLALALCFLVSGSAVAAQAPSAARGPEAGGASPSAPPLLDHTAPRDWGSADEDGLGFYRDPALHDDVLVFQAEGDLWRVPLAGGTARRLTTHPGEEAAPTISPDGATLAFTATYEGPPEVYTMPLAGGRTARRTWEGEASRATTWTPDGRLVYTTRRYSTLPRPQLVTLDPASGARERIPLAEASEAAWDADGRTLYFVRPAFHNNVTKRYRGGTARDVWRWRPGTEAVELTGDFDGESHSPLWWDGRVYFVSDRDGTMNLWSMTPDGGDLVQHTRHSGMDLRDPALSNGTFVYNVGADLWRWDVGTEAPRRIPITLSSDFDHLRETWVTDPMEYVTSVRLHPEGKSVVLTARGRVFVAPVGSGRLVRAASDDRGVRYRDAVFTADGERILALSDATGELEFVTLPANGVGDPAPLTSDGTILRFEGVPSPGGHWIAWTDNNQDLWIMRADGTDARRINTEREGVGDLAWSPDGRWLAYSEAAPNSFRQVRLHDPAADVTLDVTSDRVNSLSPAWSRDGEHLYFLSDRNLSSEVGSPWGPRSPQPYFAEPMEIYVVALREGGDSPFRPRHELMAQEEGDAAGAAGRGPAAGRAGGAGTDSAAPPTTVIDADGLAERVWRVPAPAGDYRGLTAGRDALFYYASSTGGGGPGGRLMALEVGRDGEDPVEVASGVTFYDLSADGRKVLVRRRNDLFVVDARAAKAEMDDDARVDLGGWTFPLDPREDWRQIYVDAWRLERDYFYDPGMHGVDWEAVRDRYLPLVDRVTTRDELSDVIGQVVGELSALHTSVRGGDLREGPEDVDVASLGALLARDPAAGGYRVERIWRHDPDYPSERSPLADPAAGVDEGDVIVAVNGRATLEAPDIGALLRNQAGRQVLLSVRPETGGERFDAVVVPMGSDGGLRYTDWEVTRRERVEEASGGSIGYVHLRAMGGGDITDWYRQFYPVFDRQGLIVDVRTNRGGNIDSFILNDLIKQAWMYWKTRVGRNTWNMQHAFRGHMVVLVDQSTASDGEAFAEGFRRLGLGPVIGARTWGGEIWLSSVNRLSDGGLARAPMMGVFGPEGEWLVEQVGVIPDMEVDNLPWATFNGEDAQLDAALEYLRRKIAEEPRGVPVAPAYPDRWFEYPKGRTNGGGGGR